MSDLERVALPRVLAVLESFHTSAEIYILRPLRKLARQGRILFDAREEKHLTPGILSWADLVVYGRNVTAASHPLFEEVISRGIPSVYVLDDNFWDLPSDLELDHVYRRTDQIRQLERYIRHSSRVKVFSPFLAEKVRPLNPAVLLDTPCIDFSLLPEIMPERDPARVRITYATARGQKDPFLALFAEDLRSILQKYPQQVELNLFGEPLEVFSGCGNVRQIPLNWDYPDFIRSLAGMGLDIGLAPMSETSFNLSKTNTKLRDYGACRIAGIYSKVPNYADVQDGQTGLVVEQHPGAWFDALERLVLDGSLRTAIQENAYNYVREHYRQELTEAEWEEEIYELTARPLSLLAEKTSTPPARRLFFGGGTPAAPAWRVSDRWQAGVDLVASLEAPLPFASDSLDAICLDHQVEEVQDLPELMTEVYRICRDGASVTVISTFARQDAASANPYLRQQITGQTPRYWTAADQPAPYLPEAGLPEDLAGWGLNRDGRMDFRCVRMEFFHSPEVMNLPAPQRYTARRQLWNVCDTVFFELLVVKPPGNSNGMKERMVNMQNTEPVEITLRRMRELTETQLSELDEREAARQAAELSAETERQIARNLNCQLEGEQESRRQEVNQLQVRLEAAEVEQKKLAENLAKAEQDRAARESRYQATLTEIQTAQEARYQAVQNELQTTRQSHQQQSAQYEQTVGEYQRIGKNVALQLDEERRRFIHRLVARLRDRTQLLPNIPAGLQQLLDDSFIFNRNLDGYLLQPGTSLHAVPFVPYHLSPGRAGWRGVILAGVLDVPVLEGYLGVEIVSAGQQIVAQATLQAIQFASYLPARLEFPALADSAAGEYELRVFGRGLDAPLRLLEWRKYRLGGLLRTRRKPFIGLIF